MSAKPSSRTHRRFAGLLVALAIFGSPLSSRPAAAGALEAELCTALLGGIGGGLAGYRVRATDTDSLPEDYYMEYTITFYRGYQYAVVACGDSAVHDLDIYLYDENGNLIDHDRLRDAQPVVEVRPSWTGPFRVRVVMYDTVGGRRGTYSMAVLYR